MTSKTKCVAQGAAHLAVLCLAEREVKLRVNLGVDILDIYCRRDNATRNGHHTGKSLYGSRCAQQVSSHRLG